jgi:hypothetical protein
MKAGLGRIGAYAKKNWKVIAALVLAAIPAAFLLFHKGTQQAAQTAISYPAALFGGASSPTDTNTAPTTPPVVPSAPNPDAKPCPPGYVKILGGPCIPDPFNRGANPSPDPGSAGFPPVIGGVGSGATGGQAGFLGRAAVQAAQAVGLASASGARVSQNGNTGTFVDPPSVDPLGSPLGIGSLAGPPSPSGPTSRVVAPAGTSIGGGGGATNPSPGAALFARMRSRWGSRG